MSGSVWQIQAETMIRAIRAHGFRQPLIARPHSILIVGAVRRNWEPLRHHNDNAPEAA